MESSQPDSEDKSSQKFKKSEENKDKVFEMLS